MATPCTIEGCESPTRSQGYCNKHSKRLQRNGDPLVVRRRRGLRRDDQGRKMCVRCREWCELTLFGQNKRNIDGLGSYCRPCNQSYQRLRKFGLDDEAFRALLELQNGCCAICLSPDPGPRDWNVDHDHRCCPHLRGSAVSCGECVRGLLCFSCNLAIGGMRDDARRLRAAADYLDRHSRAAITRAVS